MGTSRTCPSNDNFHHFGLIKVLIKHLHQHQQLQFKDTPTIKLQFNIDGIPLFQNSSWCFWPILCRIVNSISDKPFVVSVFCGKSKPPCLNSFLDPVIKELEKLQEHGLIISQRRYQIDISSIICDAPARSFVKLCKGHMGYGACERCIQRGVKINSRMTFPRTTAKLRDDESFRKKRDKLHHNLGDSPFLRLKIDMIKTFPLDYMHLMCLGVMKTMLNIWKSDILTNEDKHHFNLRMESLRKHFPTEFQRKGRLLDEVSHWKAVEFRTFLLYGGIVVLNGILPDDLYQHFIYFHSAARVLASPISTPGEIKFAGDCLKYFVYQYGELYGSHLLVYNVHSLIHMADECLQHGHLDAFSTFPFENYLGSLKKLLRGTKRPLAQL